MEPSACLSSMWRIAEKSLRLSVLPPAHAVSAPNQLRMLDMLPASAAGAVGGGGAAGAAFVDGAGVGAAGASSAFASDMRRWGVAEPGLVGRGWARLR